MLTSEACYAAIKLRRFDAMFSALNYRGKQRFEAKYVFFLNQF